MKPLLAYTVDDYAKLVFPLLASPKLDGIRCLTMSVEGVMTAMSRSLKPIPNEVVQDVIATIAFSGLDGELIVGDPKAGDVFNRTTSGVMTRAGDPGGGKWAFHVFDCWDYPDLRFEARLDQAKRRCVQFPKVLKYVAHKLVKNIDELLAYEAQMLLAGFEGVMVRDPNGIYKHGRSTAREGILGKLKRFEDSEAVICGFVEQQKNNNEATVGELGQTKRSSHKANKVGKGTLGTLEVRDVHSGVSFEIGTGFDDALRAEIWANRKAWMGRIVKYKHQPVGQVNKPRLPVYLGLRQD